MQISSQDHQHGRDALDQALVADQARKLDLPVTADMIQVEVLESAVIGSVKGHQQSQNFALLQAAGTAATMSSGARQQGVLPDRQKGLHKII